MLIAPQCYASGGLLQVEEDTTGVDKSTVSLAVHNADALLETRESLSMTFTADVKRQR